MAKSAPSTVEHLHAPPTILVAYLVLPSMTMVTWAPPTAEGPHAAPCTLASSLALSQAKMFPLEE